MCYVVVARGGRRTRGIYLSRENFWLDSFPPQKKKKKKRKETPNESVGFVHLSRDLFVENECRIENDERHDTVTV